MFWSGMRAEDVIFTTFLSWHRLVMQSWRIADGERKQRHHQHQSSGVACCEQIDSVKCPPTGYWSPYICPHPSSYWNKTPTVCFLSDGCSPPATLHSWSYLINIIMRSYPIRLTCKEAQLIFKLSMQSEWITLCTSFYLVPLWYFFLFFPVCRTSQLSAAAADDLVREPPRTEAAVYWSEVLDSAWGHRRSAFPGYCLLDSAM